MEQLEHEYLGSRLKFRQLLLLVLIITRVLDARATECLLDDLIVSMYV